MAEWKRLPVTVGRRQEIGIIGVGMDKAHLGGLPHKALLTDSEMLIRPAGRASYRDPLTKALIPSSR